jgi:hypothetical protein
MNQLVADMMEARSIEAQLDLVVHEEMHKLPPCEAPSHSAGLNDHRPEESAAFLFINPCGADVMMCRSWVEALSKYTHTRCSGPKGCGERHLVSDVTKIPLTM